MAREAQETPTVVAALLTVEMTNTKHPERKLSDIVHKDWV